MIFEQTYDLIKYKYGKVLNRLKISDVTIGLYLTAVRLSDGTFGTSATLMEKSPFCAKYDRDFGELTPLKIRERNVIDVLEIKKESTLISSLKTAVLNAISSKIISNGNYNILENRDPIELIDLKSGKTVTIVGAFQSYIRKISQTSNKLFVIELNENALQKDQKRYFVPAGDYKKVLPESDIVILTGQTIPNGTIDNLLAFVSPNAEVIVTGPSSGLLPDILFKNKVSVIGAIRIIKPELLFDIVREGGTGYHLFEYCAKKICIVKEQVQQINNK